MSYEQLWLEVAKLLAQAVVAFSVAKFAVGWALSRYKAEKTWDQRLSAFVEIIASLGELRSIVGAWHSELKCHIDRPEEFEKERVARYQDLRRRLENATATAHLILPQSIADRLDRLDQELNYSDDPHDAFDYGAEAKLLVAAHADLVTAGRTLLKLN